MDSILNKNRNEKVQIEEREKISREVLLEMAILLNKSDVPVSFYSTMLEGYSVLIESIIKGVEGELDKHIGFINRSIEAKKRQGESFEKQEEKISILQSQLLKINKLFPEIDAKSKELILKGAIDTIAKYNWGDIHPVLKFVKGTLDKLREAPYLREGGNKNNLQFLFNRAFLIRKPYIQESKV